MLVSANIFQPLIDVFEAVIKFFHDSAGIPWGWSIVLLTVVVRAAMIPLTLRQIKSMVRMQQLAPQLKEIQKKYKEDKQRQQQEMMKFYKENNVNPLASCLPLVAQLPVFVSLYYMLRQSLRADICPQLQPGWNAALHKVTSVAHTKVCGSHGASFLFIHDLTSKATGVTLIVLLVLYVGTQLGSSLMMSAATTDPMQRRIMLFMPLIFVLVVIRFPAGVLVYWITTNTWTIGQQYIVKRRIGPLQAAAAAGGGSTTVAAGDSGGSSGASSGGGFMGRLMARAQEAQESASTKSADGRSSRARGANGASSPAATSARSGGKSGNGSGSSRGSVGSGVSAGGTSAKSKSDGGDGAANGRSGAGAPPPRPPRKKKKRSGRRR
jgi:YidC/Oxa1 family membrane protein insertase